jgi:hypothetical protein
MAKSKSKETSLPLIISLVFFVLTTVGLGIFCYVLYSDMETKDAEVVKARKEVADVRGQLKDAELVARVDRAFFGVEKDDDLQTIETDVKEGSPAFNELKRLNEVAVSKINKLDKETNDGFNAALNKAVADAADATVAKRLADPKFTGVVGVKLNVTPITYTEDLGFFKAEVGASGSLRRTNNYGLLEVVVKSKRQRDLAMQANAQDRTGYDKGVNNMTAATKDANAARKTFTDKADTLPDDFNKQVAAIQAAADKRKKEFDAEETKLRAERSQLKDDLEKANVQVKRQEDEINRLNGQITAVTNKIKPPDPLKYDVAQGKIIRRNAADGTVEVDLGSNDRVREGLTFSILPSDYPVKGEQSRMREIRVPDGRGGFRSEVVFVPKAKIEILEVLGPTSSKAKITEEFDDIRDKAMPGDLLYSAAWRKGAAEHIALIGIFDTNGDGTDDIDQVVRDLRKMGVLVDAYYDPNRKNENGTFGGWAGTITDQTRFIVKGYFPDPAPGDPNLAKMSELNGKYTKGLEDGRRQGAVIVGLKDFFPRMGYKIRMDVTDEQIRQAARKYLDPGVTPPPVVDPGKKN